MTVIVCPLSASRLFCLRCPDGHLLGKRRALCFPLMSFKLDAVIGICVCFQFVVFRGMWSSVVSDPDQLPFACRFGQYLSKHRQHSCRILTTASCRMFLLFVIIIIIFK